MMRDVKDLDACLRSVAERLDGMSAAVEPGDVMCRSPRADRSGRRAAAAIAAVAVIAGGALLALQLRGPDEALRTTGRASQPGLAATTTSMSGPAAVDYAGVPFEQLPAGGIAVLENGRALLLDYNGLELASVGTPAAETVQSGLVLSHFEVRPEGRVEASADIKDAPPDCNGAHDAGGTRVALCGGDTQRRAQIVVITPGGTATVLINEAPGSRSAGHWRWAVPSPDGRRVLAQWSGECESPAAFIIATDGKSVKAVDGHADVATAVESTAPGWTPDGRAIVSFGEGLCGQGINPPGTYLVDPETNKRTLIRPAKDSSSGVYLWRRSPR